MGYMTVVSILNDAWDTIKKNPKQFIENIEDGMENYHAPAVQHYPVGNYANPMEVHRSFHANLNKVLVVGGNHMEDLTELKPGRISEDFYLAYKMRTIHCAEDIAASAKLEVMDAAAEMFAADMKRQGKDIASVKEFIQNSDIYKTMSDEETNKLIWMIGCKLVTM